ncbi:MAG: rhomboid family intramembrane serine protease [Bacteroidales bacterium]|jgi:membrane associated rhomboid family serine protease|nr:rhomboid family intramembrane serine protease [Bacteroidales bacterium]
MQIWNDIKRSYQSGDITTRIIYVNVAVFVVAKLLSVLITVTGPQESGTGFIMNWFAIPSMIPELIIKPWTIFTYQFLHLDFLHLIFNILWLYWFGKLFLNFFTRRQILNVYIWGGLWGAIFYLLSYNFLPYFQHNGLSGQMLGASASILAIVVATAAAAPNEEIHLALIGKIKMKYLALAVVLIDLMSVTSSNAGGHIAHLGGAFAGYWFATEYLKKNRDMTSWIGKLIDFFATFSFKQKPKMKARPNPKRAADKKSDLAFNKRKKEQQIEIDKILEKIKQSGYNSLSKTEKEILFKASK